MAHLITPVIGSGVLSVAWAVAQLGWIAGTGSIILFSLISLFTCYLLSDCYRCLKTGKRNYSYMDAVKSNLGKKHVYYIFFVEFIVILCLSLHNLVFLTPLEEKPRGCISKF